MERIVMEQELEKGLKATSQLRNLLKREKEKSHDYFNESMVVSSMKNYSNTILNSFDTSIAILKKIAQSMDMAEASSSSLNLRANGCSPSKRRDRTFDTPDLTPDGFTWRKYGQKSILNTKHPREYYRCAYKDDRKCQATKHIQKISDKPTKYRVTYFARHTCQDPLTHNNIPNINNMLESPTNGCTNYITFESPSPKQGLNPSTSTPIISEAHLSPPKPLDKIDIVGPSLANNDIAGQNQEHEVLLFSPTTLLSPNYMSNPDMDLEQFGNLIDDECFDMYDVLQDLQPFWD